MSFVQLHLHSTYSALDGAGSIKRYVQQAKNMNMPAIAVTDHGNMSGTYEMFKECIKNNLNPILGCEFYIRAAGTVEGDAAQTLIEELAAKKKNEELDAIEKEGMPEEAIDGEEMDLNDISDKHLKKAAQSFERTNYHQIVLVKNEIGWKNSLKLNYFSHLAPGESGYDPTIGGFYYKPRIERNALFQAHEGLIVTSTCMASEINRMINAGKMEEAYKIAEMYKSIFKDDYYIELQINEVNLVDVSQRKINAGLMQIARDLNIKMIITGDVHYNHKGDHHLQTALIAL